ncbi:MAG: trigger factor [bacterium]
MKVQIEEISQVKRKLQVELPAQVVIQELDKAYQDLRKNAHLKGFRPGKAPRSILERYFGEQVKEQVSSQIIEDSLGKVISEHQLRTVGRPLVEEVDLTPGQELRFTATVEVLPTIELKDYKALEVPQMDFQITDEEVSARIDEIREMFAKLEDLEEDRPVQEGDFVLLSHRFSVEGQLQGHESGQEQVVELKEGALDERIYKAVLGLRPGQEVQVPHRFPQDHPDNRLAGKEGVLEIRVGKIRKKVLPELDDSFARRLGEYSGVEELRAAIVRELEEERRKELEAQAKQAIVEQLLKLHPEFEVPESLVELEIRSMLQEARRRLVVHGVKQEETTALLAQMKDKYRDSAVRSVRSTLILQAIADKEGLEVTDEIFRNGMERIARETGRDLSQVKEIYQRPEAKESLLLSLREELALDFLRQGAKMVARKDQEQG